MATVNAASSVTLASSWSDGSLADRISYLDMAEDGMVQAEALVQEALQTSPSSSIVYALENATAAPWLDLRVGCCGVVALCLVASARVLEIHEVACHQGAPNDNSHRHKEASTSSPDGSAETIPLLTQEAQLTDMSTGLFAHFLCHGGGGALFPAQHAYRLKLFGRRPRDKICVAKVCFVLLAVEPSEEQTAEASAVPPVDVAAVATPPRSTAAPAEAAVLDAILAIQRQVLVMEQRLGGALDDVTRRLSQLESRVDKLETPGSKKNRRAAAGATDAVAAVDAAGVHREDVNTLDAVTEQAEIDYEGKC